MKKTYDRLAAGDRIRQKRNLLGFTQDEMAEKIALGAGLPDKEIKKISLKTYFLRRKDDLQAFLNNSGHCIAVGAPKFSIICSLKASVLKYTLFPYLSIIFSSKSSVKT